MKPLYLLDLENNIRRAKATIEEIVRVLDGVDSATLATVTLEADGTIVARPLNETELDKLRVDMFDRQRTALVETLDHALAAIRAGDGLRGVVTRDLVAVDLEVAPWAEDVVRDWAEAKALHVEDSKPPTKPGKWTRYTFIRVGEGWFNAAVVSLHWPACDWGGREQVAHDLEHDGRVDEAKVVREMPEATPDVEAF